MKNFQVLLSKIRVAQDYWTTVSVDLYTQLMLLKNSSKQMSLYKKYKKDN